MSRATRRFTHALPLALLAVVLAPVSTSAQVVAYPANAGLPAAAILLPFDFGDAPDGQLAGYPAPYASVVGAFPTERLTTNSRYGQPGGHVTAIDDCWLGTGVSRESGAHDPRDADGVENLIDDDADDGIVSGPCAEGTPGSPFPDPVSVLVTVKVTVAPGAPSQTRYLNVLIDRNHDGAWANGVGNVEWVVIDQPVNVAPGSSANIVLPAFLLPLNPTPMWTRIALTTDPVVGSFADDGSGWDGSGSFDAGEIEDYKMANALAFAAAARAAADWAGASASDAASVSTIALDNADDADRAADDAQDDFDALDANAVDADAAAAALSAAAAATSATTAAAVETTVAAALSATAAACDAVAVSLSAQAAACAECPCATACAFTSASVSLCSLVCVEVHSAVSACATAVAVAISHAQAQAAAAALAGAATGSHASAYANAYAEAYSDAQAAADAAADAVSYASASAAAASSASGFAIAAASAYALALSSACGGDAEAAAAAAANAMAAAQSAASASATAHAHAESAAFAWADAFAEASAFAYAYAEATTEAEATAGAAALGAAAAGGAAFGATASLSYGTISGYGSAAAASLEKLAGGISAHAEATCTFGSPAPKQAAQNPPPRRNRIRAVFGGKGAAGTPP